MNDVSPSVSFAAAELIVGALVLLAALAIDLWVLKKVEDRRRARFKKRRGEDE
jgi:hypothetical protein